MKQPNTTNIGGRIRQARINAAINMKELSELVGVTTTYLGMVERGEKNPSEALLQRIAQKTSTSFEWLYTNPAESRQRAEEIQASESAQSEFSSVQVPISINTPLFLSLVIQSVPDMSKERLAVTLGVPIETMDNILSSKDYEPNPHWADYFSLFAQQMEISTVCQKLRDIDLFLQHEDAKKGKKSLCNLLKCYAGSKYQYLAFPSKLENGEKIPSGPDILESEYIVLKKSESSKEGNCHFLYLRFALTVSDVSIQNVMDDLLVFCQYINEEVRKCEFTLVFDDEHIRDRVEDWYKGIKTSKGPGMPFDRTDLNDEKPPMTLLLVNNDTWEIRDTTELL